MELSAITWFIIIIAAAVSQGYIIEERKIYPDKLSWFLIRVGAAILWGVWMYEDGYRVEWSIIYLVTSFQWLFMTVLNWTRQLCGRDIQFHYMSTKNGTFDPFCMKLMPRHDIWWMIFLGVFITGVSWLIYYGKCTLDQIELNTCF